MNFQNTVKIIECEEYGVVPVDSSFWFNENHRVLLHSELNGRDILRTRIKGGAVQLQATSYIGVIPLNNNTVLRVHPRVPLANITRMVLETGHDVLPLRAFRGYEGRGKATDWAMDIYSDELLDRIDVVLDSGMMRTYEQREGEGHFPHGRVDIPRTIQRFVARGVPNKAAYSWHERTVDVPTNRCLKAALERALIHLLKERAQPRKGDRGKVKRLVGQLAAFNEVTLDAEARFLEDPEVLGIAPIPDSRAYYRPALDLSMLIIRDQGIALEIGGDDVQLGSLLIDTNKLFESFVRVSLVRSAANRGWPVEVLDGNHDGMVDLYDVPEGNVTGPLGSPLDALAGKLSKGAAQPDIVLRESEGGFPLIAEIKNTVHGKNSAAEDLLPERSEVEQVVTYALRYDLTFALLVHPWFKGAKGLVYVGRIRTVDVYDYRLDLSSSDGIDTALEDMADAFAHLAGISSAAV